MSYLHDFHENIGEEIVQMDATFEVNVNNQTKQFPTCRLGIFHEHIHGDIPWRYSYDT